MHRILLLAAIALGLKACSTPTTAIPADRPGDFSMLVTVFPAGEPAVPWLRPARYAVEPDGYLRAETGLGVTKPGFPPIARRLEPGEINHLYALAHQLRASDQDAPIVPGVAVYHAPADHRVVLLEIGASGHVVATEHRAGEQTEAAPLIRELARLAWLDQ